LDTLKYHDGYFAIGLTILDPIMSFEGRKIDNWTFYYPSGKICSKGNFGIGAYTECQAGGPVAVGYNFKVGQWSYWYDNGQVVTTGIYFPGALAIKTECDEDSMYISKADTTWAYLDSLGSSLRSKESVIQKINSYF
jgi:hypothetical protein